MKEAMNNFEKAFNKLMDLCKGEFGKCMFDGNMSDTDIATMLRVIELGNAAIDVMKAQTNLMIEMNDKLDKMIERKES